MRPPDPEKRTAPVSAEAALSQSNQNAPNVAAPPGRFKVGKAKCAAFYDKAVVLAWKDEMINAALRPLVPELNDGGA